MLSSTVVTVMAPHWSGRLRRSKREGMSDFQGNLQTRTEISSDVERMLSSGLQSQHRAPFVRSNTVGWSARSGPTSLDNERTMLTSASLDNKRTDRPIPSPLSSVSTPSTLSLVPHVHRLKRTTKIAAKGPLAAKFKANDEQHAFVFTKGQQSNESY
uniref:Uncharacterized protein n=1 Tax=Knipowitschia caucasica TaxID=637954 RepID=A0AAV2L6R3_KNICA